MSDDSPADLEAKMRRRFGVPEGQRPTYAQQRPDQARQRHRFVQDGEVPVTVLHRQESGTQHLDEKISSLEAALNAERHRREQAERKLAEAQEAVRALQTRIAHVEIAANEAEASARAAREQSAEREAAQASLLAAPRPRGRPRKVIDHVLEDTGAPVEWWVPGWQAK